MGDGFVNGNLTKHLLDTQREEFDALKEVLGELKDVTSAGLAGVANEIRLTREAGFLPLSLVDKILDKGEARSDRSFDIVVKVLCLIITALMGTKIFFPNLFG